MCPRCLEEFPYKENLQRHLNLPKRCQRVDAATAKKIKDRRIDEVTKVLKKQAKKQAKKSKKR